MQTRYIPQITSSLQDNVVLLIASIYMYTNVNHQADRNFFSFSCKGSCLWNAVQVTEVKLKRTLLTK